MKHPVATTQNGSTIYVDLIRSQAAINISRQPNLLNLVKELLETTTINKHNPLIHLERDMGRDIGYNYVVETKETDTILYGQLLRDETFTRFVKNGKPLTTTYLSIILRRQPGEDSYELHDTWVGRLSPPRPGSENENAQSKPYWETHAFVLDGQPVQQRTLTKDCPYETVA